MSALTIKKGQSQKSIREQWKKWAATRKKKGIDAKKYCGIITLKKDPMNIQKAMRNEWE